MKTDFSDSHCIGIIFSVRLVMFVFMLCSSNSKFAYKAHIICYEAHIVCYEAHIICYEANIISYRKKVADLVSLLSKLQTMST